MKMRIIIIAVVLFVSSPVLPESHIVPKEKIPTQRLILGEEIYLVYANHKGKRDKAKGFIKSITDDSLTIGKGLWNDTIAFSDMIRMTIEREVIEIGDTVRVTTAKTFRGQLVHYGTDSLTLATGGFGNQQFAFKDLNKIEVMERSSLGSEGAVLGGCVGLTLGVIALSVALPESNDEFLAGLEYIPHMFVATIGSVVVGTFVGAKIGRGKTKTTWHSATIDRIQFSYQHDGMVRLKVAFK